MDTWALIAAERGRLVDMLATLSDQEWAAPSLCTGWTSKDVLAHIVSTAEMTPRRFLVAMARNGFAFDKMTARNVAASAGEPAASLVERLRRDVERRDHPPGPTASWLLETIVHGEDIAHPLGRTIAHGPEALVAAADFAKGAQPLIGCRKRIAGLRLVADDAEWSTGSGPEVRGPLRLLLLAMTGREAALAGLTGDGVEILSDRVRAG